MPYDEVAEAELLDDPRYEAGLALRKEGSYEDAVEFFSELLKSSELPEREKDEEQQELLHLAPLLYDYGSTLVCLVEKQRSTEDEGEEGRKAKKAKISDACGSNEASSRGPAEGGGESDEESEEEEEDDDVTVAWQCLDSSRSLFEKGLSCGSLPAALTCRLRRSLARVVSRIGDLNMATASFGHALVEYEQAIKLREMEGDRDTSVEGICTFSDIHIQVKLSLFQSSCDTSLTQTTIVFQVSLCYLGHIGTHGYIDIVIRNSDEEDTVVAKGEECLAQALAYMEQVKSILSNLVSKLARDRVQCSVTVELLVSND